LVTFKWLDKTYEILGERKEQLLRDFQHCEEIKDYGTINNRIIKGTKWGWLKDLNNLKQTNK